jgi:hypothetical protein
VTTTSPRSVNFTALLSRLTSTCRTRVTSPTSTGGHARLERGHEVQALGAGLRGDQVERALHAVADGERLVLSSSWPLSIFPRSRGCR